MVFYWVGGCEVWVCDECMEGMGEGGQPVWVGVRCGGVMGAWRGMGEGGQPVWVGVRCGDVMSAWRGRGRGGKLCDWEVYIVECVTIDYLGVKIEAVYEIMSYSLAVSSIITWVSRGTVSSLISVLSTWIPPTSQRGQTWAASMSLLHSLRECNIEYPFN